MTIRVEMKLQGAEQLLSALRRLPPEVVSKRGGPVKLALAKGARFLRDRAKENLRAQIAKGPTTNSTGELEKRVIASRGKAPFGGKGERYLVRVKRRDYVNAHGERTNPLMTANLMEYGSVHQPARPWIRPVVPAHGRAVINMVTTDLGKRIEREFAKLANAGGGA